MTFFQNNPPESGDGAETSSHSPRSAPLFKQDAPDSEPLAPGTLSLNEYISRHLAASTESPTLTPQTGSFRKTVMPSANSKMRQELSENAPAGQFLNSLDVELAAGLEQYLPTPMFRLRVVKKRLDGEIQELRMLLNKYNRLPNPSLDMKDRIVSAKHRLRVLENHERKVAQQLAKALPFGFWLHQFSQGSRSMSGFLWGWVPSLQNILIQLMYGKSYLSVEAASDDLRNLQDLYTRRLNDTTASSAELGQILNRYEKTLRQAEQQAQNLSRRSPVFRLWQDGKRLVE